MPIAPIHDLDLVYDELGAGEPLVLVGDFAQPRSGWGGLPGALAGQFRVITFDNRGTGESGQPDVPFSIETMADDVSVLLDHIEVRGAAIVGVGLGGMIALQFARTHGDRAKKLALLATAAHLDAYARALLKNLDDLRRSSIPDIEFARHLSFFLHARSYFERDGALESAARGLGAEPYPRLDYGFQRQVEAALAFDAIEAPLSAIRQETLVAGAEEDIFFAPALARALADELPNARYIDLPGGHHGFTEHPTAWAEAIARFLSNDNS